MAQFILSFTFCNFVYSVETKLMDEAAGTVKEADFAHKSIISINRIRSLIPSRESLGHTWIQTVMKRYSMKNKTQTRKLGVYKILMNTFVH